MEWATAHRVATYLDNHFRDWHVDCEYNKANDSYDPKRNSTGDKKRPDIVIHRRGKVDKANNLLVIEIKMKQAGDANDLEKLKDFTSPPVGKRSFQYQLGMRLEFNPVKYTWYKNGGEISL